MFDTIIIGLGPAGMTAGIYAKRREMKTLIIGKELGGQVIWASEIENYPGFKSISNTDLINKMYDQVKSLGAEIKMDEVATIEPVYNNKNLEHFIVKTKKEKFLGKTVILTMGLAPRRLAIPGEEKFNGKGISYCANCDGPFYKNKTVAVVGGGNAAFDAAEILSKISEKVYLIHRRQEFRAFEALINEVKNRDNIEMILDSEIEEIMGNERVEGIKVINIKTNASQELKVDGIFIEIGRIAHTDLIADLVKRDEKGMIIVNNKFETSQEGIFAAGDVTPLEFKQITIACGQATVAALAAYQYLQLKQGGSVDKVLDRGKKME